MGIASRMVELLGESEDELKMKNVMAQLAVAMHGLNLDPQDENAQDKFIGLLKKLSANPKTMKTMLARHSGATASAKALRAAKAAI